MNIEKGTGVTRQSGVDQQLSSSSSFILFPLSFLFRLFLHSLEFLFSCPHSPVGDAFRCLLPAAVVVVVVVVL
jgi:hypothetical protein